MIETRYRIWTPTLKWASDVSQSLFARQVGFTVLTQGISLILSMATAAITARWLGPEGKGLLALILLVPSTLQMFLNLGIGVANVYYVGSGRLSVRQLTANSLTFSLFGTAAGVLVVFLLLMGGAIPLLLPGVSTGYLLLGLITLPLGLSIANLQTILQGLRRILTLNIFSVAQAVLTPPLMALFIIRMGLGVLGALVATLAIQALMLGAVSACLGREGGSFRPEWDARVVRTTLHFGLKGYVGNLLQFFNYRLDTFIVNFFLGPAGVGIYGVAVGLAELLWQVPNAASFVIFPKAAGSTHEAMNHFTPRVFWIILAISSIGATGVAFFGKLAIRVIFSSAFLAAYIPLLVLLPGVVLLGGAKILANDIAGRGYPHYNSITAGLSLAMTIVLDLSLIPQMGVPGAALASTVSYALTLLASVGFYLKVSHRPAAEAASAGAGTIATTYDPGDGGFYRRGCRPSNRS